MNELAIAQAMSKVKASGTFVELIISELGASLDHDGLVSETLLAVQAKAACHGLVVYVDFRETEREYVLTIKQPD